MTPEEARDRYDAEWPALHEACRVAVDACDTAAAKKCRQALSALSIRCKARFELLSPPPEEECPVNFCPCCGKRVTHE